MATTFKFWDDTGRTSAFSNLFQIEHNTDLSDNDQDFVIYFGSNASSTTLEAVSNPGVDNVTITPTDNLDDWAATTAYSLGAEIEPTTPNTYYYQATVAGTSAGSEPTWPTTIGDTVVDGTVTWTCVAKRHEITEIKLASTSGGLAGATPGAALNLGTTLNSGQSYEVHVRITNAVTTVSDTTSYGHITLNINNCEEKAQ